MTKLEIFAFANIQIKYSQLLKINIRDITRQYTIMQWMTIIIFIRDSDEFNAKYESLGAEIQRRPKSEEIR